MPRFSSTTRLRAACRSNWLQISGLCISANAILLNPALSRQNYFKTNLKFLPQSQQQEKTLGRPETAASTTHQHFQAFAEVNWLKNRKRWRFQESFRHRTLALVSVQLRQQVLTTPGGCPTRLYQPCLLPGKSEKPRGFQLAKLDR